MASKSLILSLMMNLAACCLLGLTSFERIEHDIKYEEYIKLKDIFNALRIEGPGKHHFKNKALLASLDNEITKLKFPEDFADFDPFKDRVLKSLALGLTQASITHQLIQEDEIFYAQTLDQEVLNKKKYPYKADLIMGYKG